MYIRPAAAPAAAKYLMTTLRPGCCELYAVVDGEKRMHFDIIILINSVILAAGKIIARGKDSV